MPTKPLKNFFLGPIRSLDAFGAPVQLRVDGQRFQKTICGAIFTCTLFFFMIWFLAHLVLLYVQRSDQLRMHHKTLQRGDTNGYIQNMRFYAGETTPGANLASTIDTVTIGNPITEPTDWVKNERVSQDQVLQGISKSHRFNVAFGLSDFADSPDNIEDHLYGNLVAMRTYRDLDGKLSQHKLTSEPCQSETLKDKFYPSNPYVTKNIEFNQPKLNCLAADQEDVPVFGEYDEPDSQSFSIYFTSCETLYNANCKSIQEVSEWLSHKYLLVVYTERRFSHENGEAIEDTKLARIPINKVTNTHYKFEIEVTHLVNLDNLENTIWPVGDRTYQDFYRIKQLPDQPLIERLPPNDFTEYFPNRFQVSFEVSSDQNEVHVLPQFTLLEIVGSVGGLLFAGYIVGQLIFPLCAKFHLENSLISRIYGNAVQKQSERPPWENAPKKSAKVGIFDIEENGDKMTNHDGVVDNKSSGTLYHQDGLRLTGGENQDDDQIFEGGQREALRHRDKIVPSKAYCCLGLIGIPYCCTRQGKAARMGKQMLKKHLEVSRILKKLNHTKTALELMLMPNQTGLRKANKKLFPVCSTLNDFSDSSSEEEQMLAIALENAQNNQRATTELSNISASENIFKKQEQVAGNGPQLDLGDTMRCLVDRDNKAGVAYYDSARMILDQVTESQATISINNGDFSPTKASNKTKSSGGRRRGKKSHASIVLEEPSKEDHGFAFHSRHTLGCSVKSSQRYLTQSSKSINISIKTGKDNMSPISDKLSSPINQNWLKKIEHPSPIREMVSSPRKSSTKKRAIEKSHRSSLASQSPPKQRDVSLGSGSPKMRRSLKQDSIGESPYAQKPILMTTEILPGQSLKSKMIQRIKKKQQSPSQQNSTTLRLSARKPSYQKGIFEPVNPNRQRIIAIENNGHQEAQDNVRTLFPDSHCSGDPYPSTIIIYGDSEKLQPQKSSRKGSHQSHVEEPEDSKANFDFTKPNFTFSRKNQTTTARSPTSSTIARLEADDQGGMKLERMILAESSIPIGFSLKDYKPPPSAPAGQHGRNRNRQTKLYKTLNARPYQIAIDRSLNSPKRSMSPPSMQELGKSGPFSKQGASSGLRSIQRNDQAFKSIVHVPDQKLGVNRTRIYLQTERDANEIVPPTSNLNNFLQNEQHTVESNENPLMDSVIVENSTYVAEAPFEESKQTSSSMHREREE